jgi:HEAT repeat protein
LWEDFPGSLPGLIVRLRQCLPLVRFGFDEPVTAMDFDAAEYRAKGLKDKDREVRYRALMFLQHLGPKAAPAVPELVEALGDSDERIQREAELTLMWIGRPILPAVLPLLEDKRPHIRAHALFLVGQVAPRGTDRQETRGIALKVLRALHDDSVQVRRQAAWVAGHFGKDCEEVIAALIEALKVKDVTGTDNVSNVPRNAADALGRLGPFAKPAVPALMESSKADDNYLRWAAFDALGRIAAQEPSVQPTLIPWLIDILKEEKQGSQRARAAHALGVIGPPAKDAVSALRSALHFEDNQDLKTAEWIRISATTALGKIGPAAEAAVPDLITALKKDKKLAATERSTAAEALGEIGPAAKAAIPTLTEIAKDSLDSAQQTAARALERIRR